MSQHSHALTAPTQKHTLMISHISPSCVREAKNVYNQSIVVYPNGESVYRRCLPVQSKSRDSVQVRMLEALGKRLENSHQCGVVDNNRKAIALEPKEPKVRTGWGALPEKWKNFTNKAKRTLRYGAAAMELKLGKELCKFATLTVPGSTPEATKVIAEHSGYIMNRIKQWIRDNFSHSDGSQYVIGVVELQKRGMLHWHFLIGLESFFYYEKLAKGIATLWYELLSQLSDKTGINLFEKSNGHDWRLQWEKIQHRAVRVEHVNKSVSNYLAKYMGKNPYKNVKEVQWKGVKYKVYSPSKWSTCSRDVNKLIAEYTIRYDVHPTYSSLIDEIFEFTKDVFKSFGFWTVETLNPWSKEKIGVLARGKYEDAKEACDVLHGIVNEVSTACRQDVDRNYKLYHSADFGYTKRLDYELQEQQFIEYLDAEGTPYFMRRKSQYRIHKKYWEAINRGDTMQEAFRYSGLSF